MPPRARNSAWPKIMFNDKSILVTGGTGSFGKQYVKTILQRYQARKLII